MWARWALSLAVGVILLVALVVFVNHNNNNSLATEDPAAVARADREAVIVVSQDQAPHVLALAPGESPRAGMVRAVRATMTKMIDTGVVLGPLTRVHCAADGSRAGTTAFRCTAEAADVNYPFLGVVSLRARHLTYCKRDYPPVPSMSIPVSARCDLPAR